MIVRNEPMTVGRLRGLLAEYHESDSVFYDDHGLLFRVNVDKGPTAAGVAVLLCRGERVSFGGQSEVTE